MTTESDFFRDLLRAQGDWVRAHGPDSDVVLSTRIRLARNLGGQPFLTRLSPKATSELEKDLRARILEAFAGTPLHYWNLREVAPLDRLLLLERHLVSREHANGHGDRGVAFGEKERFSLMTLEEDHLRLQILGSGFEPDVLWSEMDALDDRLEAVVDYAFSGELGYLTACPTNVGTGMRVSVMLHLPSLVLTKQIEKVFRGVSQMNLAVRGYYGEGTQAKGDFYQISNQVTLGKSETEIIEEIRRILPKIVEFERMVRRQLLAERRKALEDRVFRSLGQLRSCRTISSEETMALLSSIRLGLGLGLIRGMPLAGVNELFILAQPAHLQKLEGRLLKTSERDEARAAFLRGRLEAFTEAG